MAKEQMERRSVGKRDRRRGGVLLAVGGLAVGLLASGFTTLASRMKLAIKPGATRKALVRKAQALKKKGKKEEGLCLIIICCSARGYF